MKKTIANPNYEKATVSLGWIAHGKIGTGDPGPRFMSRPPPAAYQSQATLDQWIAKNAIYPTIEVEE